MNFDKWTSAWPQIRDVMIVTTALALIVYEAVFYPGPVRESLLLAYTGLLASPVFLRSDKRPRAPLPPDDLQEADT